MRLLQIIWYTYLYSLRIPSSIIFDFVQYAFGILIHTNCVDISELFFLFLFSYQKSIKLFDSEFWSFNVFFFIFRLIFVCLFNVWLWKRWKPLSERMISINNKTNFILRIMRFLQYAETYDTRIFTAIRFWNIYANYIIRR